MSGEIRNPDVEQNSPVVISPENFYVDGYREQIHDLATQMDFIKIRLQSNEVTPPQSHELYKLVAFRLKGFEIVDLFVDQLGEMHSHVVHRPDHHSGTALASVGNHAYEAVFDQDRSRLSLVMYDFRMSDVGLGYYSGNQDRSVIFRPTVTRSNTGHAAARLQHFVAWAEDFGIIYR